jgi:hypothetical protein
MILDHRILLRVEDGRLVPGAPGAASDVTRTAVSRSGSPARYLYLILYSEH